MNENESIRRAASSVESRDLLAIGAWERFCGFSLSAPFLIVEFLAIHTGRPAIAMAVAFVFFTAGWRQAHDAMHNMLRIGRRWNDLLLLILSSLMLVPQHAVKHCHLRHHADPLAADDVEAWGAHGGLLRALLLGPTFAPRLIARALVRGDRATRVWVVSEIVLVALVIVGAARSESVVWRTHVFFMLLGVGFTGDVAVWVGHRGCASEGNVARTQRSRWLGVLTFELIYHFEHHCFPAVPICRLPELGRRIDRALVERSSRLVLRIPEVRARRRDRCPQAV